MGLLGVGFARRAPPPAFDAAGRHAPRKSLCLQLFQEQEGVSRGAITARHRWQKRLHAGVAFGFEANLKGPFR
jgi:hypothetical protein